MSKYIVLSAKPYDFENDKKERVQGVRISYLNKKPSVREGEYGYPPMIVSLSDSELMKKVDFKKVPGVYDMDFEQVTGKNNKPELVLTDMQYLSDADLSIFFQ